MRSPNTADTLYEEEIFRYREERSAKREEIEEISGKLSGLEGNKDKYNSEIRRYQTLHTEQTRLVNERAKGLETDK